MRVQFCLRTVIAGVSLRAPPLPFSHFLASLSDFFVCCCLSQDVSIFGDFGAKKSKSGGDKKVKKKGKKGEEEEDAKPSKSYKVADDDDMPEGEI